MKISIIIKDLPPMANGGHGSIMASAASRKEWKMKAARELIGLQPDRPYQKIKVTFTRCSSVEPDDDGNAHGFKPIRDALVKFGFVVDDKKKNMEAIYQWEHSPRGKGFVKVEIEGIEQ